MSTPPTPSTTWSVNNKDETESQSQRRDHVKELVPSFVTLSVGLAAVSSSSNHPKASLLFAGAGAAAICIYSIALPTDDAKSPIVVAFLRLLPKLFMAVSCLIAILGIGFVFPTQTALIPLFAFISFAVLAALFGQALGVLVTAVLYFTSLVSLFIFVVLACLA